MFALVDCNNFYASCQRVFNPKLVGKPIVVLSNNDGCVIARSNEAKALGIPMGAPEFQFKKLFEEKNVNVFSANFTLYGDMSNRVMSILSEYSPEVEIYSIDEIFLKLVGYERFDLKEFFKGIQRKVLQWTGIPISIGVAKTKALAKAANRIAKKYPVQTESVHLIDTEEKRIKALKWLEVGDVWGIGGQHTKKLQFMNVKTAYDFTKVHSGWIKKNMAIVGVRLQQDLQGIPTLDLDETKAKQNIATTRSFDSNYGDYQLLKERITTFTVSCGEKMRKQKSCCKAITVFLLTNRFREDQPQYNPKITVKLPFPTSSNIELTKFALIALKAIFKEGYGYKKAGVILSDFVPEDNLQRTLFQNRSPKEVKLMQVIDKVNNGYGAQKIKMGGQDLRRVWIMRQERLSPCYTTRIKDVIVVKC